MAIELSRMLSKEGKKYVASQKVHSYGYIAILLKTGVLASEFSNGIIRC